MLKISVIIPVYRVRRFIEKCIDSIIIQECEGVNLECILVNDYIPDDSIDLDNPPKYPWQEYYTYVFYVLMRGVYLYENNVISIGKNKIQYYGNQCKKSKNKATFLKKCMT